MRPAEKSRRQEAHARKLVMLGMCVCVKLGGRIPPGPGSGGAFVGVSTGVLPLPYWMRNPPAQHVEIAWK